MKPNSIFKDHGYWRFGWVILLFITLLVVVGTTDDT